MSCFSTLSKHKLPLVYFNAEHLLCGAFQYFVHKCVIWNTPFIYSSTLVIMYNRVCHNWAFKNICICPTASD